ncbi:MAG: Hpt domain-containing protein [Proteobacteria bacterium]|nr:Hpt domain-containing protein [Pseudomonadota bacterium]
MSAADPDRVDPDGMNRTALILEDSASVAQFVHALLTRWGFAVRRVSDVAAIEAGTEDISCDLAIVGSAAKGAETVIAAIGATAGIVALTTDGEALDGATVSIALPPSRASLAEAVHVCLIRDIQPLDPVAIATLWGSTDNTGFRLVAAAFAGEFRDCMARIETALASGDRHRIELDAHSLKGAAGSVGAPAIRRIAARLEAAAERGNLSKAAPLVEALREAGDAGLTALERLTGSDSSSP